MFCGFGCREVGEFFNYLIDGQSALNLVRLCGIEGTGYQPNITGKKFLLPSDDENYDFTKINPYQQDKCLT